MNNQQNEQANYQTNKQTINKLIKRTQPSKKFVKQTYKRTYKQQDKQTNTPSSKQTTLIYQNSRLLQFEILDFTIFCCVCVDYCLLRMLQFINDRFDNSQKLLAKSKE